MSNETNGRGDLKELNLTTQDSSYFNDFVTVISGARQTANQEFNRFWEKFGFNKAGSNNNSYTSSSVQTSTTMNNNSNSRKMIRYNSREEQESSFISRNKSDIARMRNGQDIYGRIIPDTNRRGYIKDADMQTDDVAKEKEEEFASLPSLSSPPLAVQHQAETTTKQDTPRITNKRKPSPISSSDGLLSRPQKMLKTDATPPSSLSPLRPTTTATASKAENEKIRVKQLPSSTRHFTPNSSPLNLSPIKLSPIKLSPERKNSIVTGSSKSVKRLTSELEETFLPRFPHPYLPTTTTAKPTPRRIFSTLGSETSSVAASESNQDPFLSTPLIKHSQPAVAAPTATQNRSLLSQEEEDERVAQLQKKVTSIRSQMEVEFVSYPASIKSPTPSHTVSSSNMIYRTIEQEEMITPVESSNSSPVKSFTINSNKTSPPYKSNGSPSRVVPPPPAPPAPPVAVVVKTTFSPVRDNTPFRYHYNNSPTTNGRSFTPVRSFTLVKDEQKKSSPAALKPNDKHKQKMRELIQLIPGVKLRKTDKIIGPDGTERPNPFWNEIYNPGNRRIY